MDRSSEDKSKQAKKETNKTVSAGKKSSQEETASKPVVKQEVVDREAVLKQIENNDFTGYEMSLAEKGPEETKKLMRILPELTDRELLEQRKALGITPKPHPRQLNRWEILHFEREAKLKAMAKMSREEFLALGRT